MKKRNLFMYMAIVNLIGCYVSLFLGHSLGNAYLLSPMFMIMHYQWNPPSKYMRIYGKDLTLNIKSDRFNWEKDK